MKNKKMIINKQKGILIVYEGISGSGKSEAIGKLKRYLSALGIETTDIEWNSNPRIRRFVSVLQRMGLLTPSVYSFFQWFGFWLEYVRVISPALKQNKVVLADRYLYTALTRDDANKATRLFGRCLTPWFRKPDWVIFYDIPVTVCYDRIVARGKELFYPKKLFRKSETISNFDYLTMIRDAYLHMFDRLKVHNYTNLLFVTNDKLNVLLMIEQYILQKKDTVNHTKGGKSERSVGLLRKDV